MDTTIDFSYISIDEYGYKEQYQGRVWCGQANTVNVELADGEITHFIGFVVSQDGICKIILSSVNQIESEVDSQIWGATYHLFVNNPLVKKWIKDTCHQIVQKIASRMKFKYQVQLKDLIYERLIHNML